MSFRFNDDLTAHYYTYGYAVLRQIIPPAMIEDLRRATDKVREMARAEHGGQAQRLQMIAEYEGLDLAPFRAWAELPEFCDAVANLLTPHHVPSLPHSILLEPAHRPYTVGWHRDHTPESDLGDKEWSEVRYDIDFFNQTNAPLYDDTSLWVVPGSHFRSDLPSEREAVGDRSGMSSVIGTAEAEAFASITKRPGFYADKQAMLKTFDDMSDAEREYRGFAVCDSMPGGTCLMLRAGDVAVYRNTIWHNGTYVPYVKRATLHGAIDTPAYTAWLTKIRRARAEASAS